jgi:hypothetical protein
MSLDIGKVLTEGFSSLFSKIGVKFAAIFFVFSGLYQSGFEGLAFTEGSMPLTTLALTSSTVVNLLMIAVGGLGYLMSFFLVIQHFYSKQKSLDFSIVSWSITSVLNLLMASIIFAAVVLTGLFFLVVPGIYLYVALIFYSIAVVVDGANAVEALKKSWKITRGSRLKVFVVLFLISAISLILTLLTSVVTIGVELLSLSKAIGFAAGLLIQLLGSFIMVLLFSTLTAAYRSLEDN